MIVYEVKDGAVEKLKAAGTAPELVVDAGLLLANLYHAQANEDLKNFFREKITAMVDSGYLWSDETKGDFSASTLSFDLHAPGMDTFTERMEEDFWNRRHDNQE